MRKNLVSPLLALFIIASGFVLNAIVQPSGSGFIGADAISLFGTSPLDSLRRESARLERRITLLKQMNDEITEALPEVAISRDVRELGEQIAQVEEHLTVSPITDGMAEAQLRTAVARQERFVKALSNLVDERRDMAEAMPALTPTTGWLSSGFGERVHPVSGVRRKHTGVDLAAPKGTAITAANAGKVVFAGVKGGYGNAVVIDHGHGYQTLYGHASKLLVKKGAEIQKGDPIALVGSTGVSTGPHLHYEVIVDSSKINPKSFLNEPPVLVASSTLASLVKEYGHDHEAEVKAAAKKKGKSTVKKSKAKSRKTLLAKKGKKSKGRGTIALADRHGRSRM